MGPDSIHTDARSRGGYRSGAEAPCQRANRERTHDQVEEHVEGVGPAGFEDEA